MAPMWSADTIEDALAPHAGRLIALARDSIRHGLENGRPVPVALSGFDPILSAPCASFVTLRAGPALRGCVGSIDPRGALAEDVARNAFLAAFADSRFDPLGPPELPGLSIEISVLGPHLPIAFASEAELLAALVPGRDGLIVERDGRRGVFLPQVWDDLPDPAEFLFHLKEKAGLGAAPLDRTAEARRFAVVKLTAASALS